MYIDLIIISARPVLKKTAVPSQFPWSEKSSSHPKKKVRNQRRLARNKNKNSVQVPIKDEKTKDDTCLMENTYCEVEIEFEEKQKETGVKCDSGKGSNTFKECPKCDKKSKQSSIENVLDVNNVAEIEFYSGYQDYEHIKFIFSLFGDKVNSLKYYPNMKTLKVPFINPCHQFYLLSINQIMLEHLIHRTPRLKINKTVTNNIKQHFYNMDQLLIL